MAQDKKQPNEGEGNKTAARHYNEATERFAQSGKVEPKAKEAKEAMKDPASRAELAKAEEKGKAKAKK